MTKLHVKFQLLDDNQAILFIVNMKGFSNQPVLVGFIEKEEMIVKLYNQLSKFVV